MTLLMPMPLRMLPRRIRWRGVRSFAAHLGAIFAVVALGCAMSLVLTMLQGRASAAHQSAREATRVVDVVRTIDGLEWRAVSGEEIDPIIVEVERSRGLLNESLERSVASSAELLSGFDAYVSAVADMLVALDSGDEEVAREIDEERVDPQFERVVETASSIATAKQEAATSTERTVRLLTWLVSMVAVVVCAALLWVASVARERTRSSAVDRRFRSLVESSRDVIAVCGVEQVEFLSPTMGPLTDFCTTEDGVYDRDFLPESVRAVWLAADDCLAADGGHQELEFKLERSDGSVLWIEAEGHRLDRVGDERVWAWRDITIRKTLELQLTHQAFHDSLTGMANRLLLRDRVDHALSRSVRPGAAPVSLLFCDLDNFKAVNDSIGHSHGDQLLEVVAARISGCVRPGDTVARLGGDEFAILLEDADVDKAEALAERLLSVVAYEVDIDGRSVNPSMSIGIATAVAGTTTDELLRNADIAMYSAKRSGKGRSAVFQNLMHQATNDEYELLSDLKNALAEGQLSLHYQPTIGLETGRVDGVEALLRWEHPTRGQIRPDIFVPVAEACGLIGEIGNWLIADACRAAVQLQDVGGHHLLMHVNLSPHQLHDHRIVATVREALDNSGLRPERLVLEVTEGILIDDPIAVNRLHELHALGVLIAIDDFGTGYTSINYLQQLPVQILKIDRSFVSGNALGPNERNAFLQAIIGLAKSLHLHSVAEGIEEVGQLDELRALGCDSGQGFLWAKARPLIETQAAIDAIELANAAASVR
jgi:diguanylate cyclase (GGDEF)-like protein